jgi:hypothetical protein
VFLCCASISPGAEDQGITNLMDCGTQSTYKEVAGSRLQLATWGWDDHAARMSKHLWGALASSPRGAQCTARSTYLPI